ncbi:AP2/ERF domain-containing protein [Psidium guajava]|nr:AP2/ERF domain-containing protein [Psidium guajava]
MRSFEELVATAPAGGSLEMGRPTERSFEYFLEVDLWFGFSVPAHSQNQPPSTTGQKVTDRTKTNDVCRATGCSDVASNHLRLVSIEKPLVPDRSAQQSPAHDLSLLVEPREQHPPSLGFAVLERLACAHGTISGGAPNQLGRTSLGFNFSPDGFRLNGNSNFDALGRDSRFHIDRYEISRK